MGPRQLVFRLPLVGCAALLLPAALIRANPPAPLVNRVGTASGPSVAPDLSIDPILQQLDQVGKNLREFSAKLKLTETDNDLGTSTVRTGKVYFQKKPDGTARIHVIFDRRIDEDRKLAFPEKVEYLLDGAWLIDRNYQTKNEVKRQVLKREQKMDLFKLGEGPFPLPIGQDPADVHKAFDVKRAPAAKDDPPQSVHLTLLPKAGSDLARKFESIDVWVDGKTHMPVRVDTGAKHQTRSTELNDVVVNPPGGLKESDFQLPNIDQNWNRHVESLNP